MADWTDSALSAPTEPPTGFAMPVVTPLTTENAKTEPQLEANLQNLVLDDFQPPSQPGRPLEQIASTSLHSRDPRLPFTPDQIETLAPSSWDPTQPLGPVTDTQPNRQSHNSAWGATSTRPSARQNVFPPPDGSFPQLGAAFPPPNTEYPQLGAGNPTPATQHFPSQSKPTASPKSTSSTSIPKTGALTFGQSVAACGYPMLLALAAAAFFQDFGLYLMIVAWLLSAQAARQPRLFRQITSSVIVIRVAITLLNTADLVLLPWNASETFLSWACVIMLVGFPTIVYYSSRRKVTHRRG